MRREVKGIVYQYRCKTWFPQPSLPSSIQSSTLAISFHLVHRQHHHFPQQLYFIRFQKKTIIYLIKYHFMLFTNNTMIYLSNLVLNDSSSTGSASATLIIYFLVIISRTFRFFLYQDSILSEIPYVGYNAHFILCYG